MRTWHAGEQVKLNSELSKPDIFKWHGKEFAGMMPEKQALENYVEKKQHMREC